MSQLSFSDPEYARKRRKTRREILLDEMDLVVPWKVLLKVIEPFYPVTGRGRRPYALKTMLRVHLLQNWLSAQANLTSKICTAAAALVFSATGVSEEIQGPTYVGTMNGTAVVIPRRYEKSAFVNFRGAYVEYHSANDFRDKGVVPEGITDISLYLRRENFEPILSQADEVDFHMHRRDPPELRETRHRWLEIEVRPTVGFKAEYAGLLSSIKRPARCESGRYAGLRYCRVPGATDLHEVSEYYFDEHSDRTLIWCRRVRGHNFFCTHLFVSDVPSIGIYTEYRSPDQVKGWKEVEGKVRPIASKFLRGGTLR
jgi:hypothetical protein